MLVVGFRPRAPLKSNKISNLSFFRIASVVSIRRWVALGYSGYSGYSGISGIAVSSNGTPSHLHLELSLNTKPAYFNDGTTTITGVVADGRNVGDAVFTFPDVLTNGASGISEQTEIKLPHVNSPAVAVDDFLGADTPLAVGEDGTIRIPLAKLLANDVDADGDSLILTDFDGDGSGRAAKPWGGKGWPEASVTACSFELIPPLFRPIRRP